jgi:hypothetical protein
MPPSSENVVISSNGRKMTSGAGDDRLDVVHDASHPAGRDRDLGAGFLRERCGEIQQAGVVDHPGLMTRISVTPT